MPAPVLAGLTLPRPNRAPQSMASVGGDVVLASGALVRYDRGRRPSWTLSWTRMRSADAALVQQAAAVRGAVTYTDVLGVSTLVFVDDPALDPIPGTDPMRYDVSVKLTAVRPV